MAKGAQDWVARTDILVQSLADLIMRPRLGTQYAVEVSGYLGANTENLIVDISGAGMWWVIAFSASSTGLMDNDYFKFIVDGTIMTTPTMLQFLTKNFSMGNPLHAYGTLYDAVNFQIAGGGQLNYTWNTSYKLYYVETQGRNPLANLRFVYSIF